MTPRDRYFELRYGNKISEFSRIDSFKKWPNGEARRSYTSLDDFFMKEIKMTKDELENVKKYYEEYHELYYRYCNGNECRWNLFKNHDELMKWYRGFNETCEYCGITQYELNLIVEQRSGNLTINRKTKRSRGTIEIEKRNPCLGYTYNNSVLCCPFCNNAKSNLISEDDWRKYFVPAMKAYRESLIGSRDTAPPSDALP